MHVQSGFPGEKCLNFAVAAVFAALVPKTQGDDTRRALAERPDGFQISGQIAAVVAFKAVEGDADLVESGGVSENFGVLSQKSAVGGEADTETKVTCDQQKLGQIRVEQRLAHDVKIEVVRIGAELFRENAEFRGRHGAGRADRTGAEGAMEIANIGDLHVRAFEHFSTPFFVSSALCICFFNIVTHNKRKKK